jgi:TnpA family transposase
MPKAGMPDLFLEIM